MLRVFAAISVFTALTGCSNVTFHTDIDNDVLSEEIGTYVKKRDLQQFYSDQEAHESGATLLGRIEGESCNGDGRGNSSISYNRSKSESIDLLKADAMRRGGNAFTINSCREISVSYCDLSVLCSGQAYDY
ncbi:MULTISPECIES: hypothetical protein [Pseudoalteromonas]|uniref:Uncharacterized protein n=1 Tax=Pseudoalteromonas undina TaxID=43660 RepID=A0ACC6R3V4_9GAMM|nr:MULTISPECIES: hypothetical protein [unclassified Pseudoalteromonas]KPZ57447.1 hypothetical protein AN393_00697 [Pseudoalteromonas sp. P1-25]KPZ57699.1 hypothetical protein AN391_01852 [Pseudoalteromonas sp. P1-13-1a]KPZ62404.1 hypothetical protein AN389_00857 [Pseudoalteromonas sp. P1-7a]